LCDFCRKDVLAVSLAPAAFFDEAVDMHTKDLARLLHAFAGIADFERSEDLHRLASFFDREKNQTVSARIKHVAPSSRYPLRLKQTLEAIEAGLRFSGAIKPSRQIAQVQRIFAGTANGSLDDFLSEIAAPSPKTNDVSRRRFKNADLSLANRLSSDLHALKSDAGAFRARLDELASSSSAGIGTWTLVANQFTGNRKIYRDRKSAVRAIQRHCDDVAHRD
jgi:hypothetical protein